ncbi:MAG: M48 family metalloprotease [Planctomycetes bacterium]|nr:M48 family metalloprotease [Planctomycetota bacterium]
MMDLCLSMGLSNACFALALALAATAAGAKTRRPHLAHLFWLLVFVKLVTPPLVTIPVSVFSPPTGDAGAGARAFVAGAPSAMGDTTPGSPLLSRLAPLWNRVKPGVAALWLVGSLVVLVWSMVRVYRFGRLLTTQSEVAPLELQQEAERIARRLGLATTPAIRTVAAHLSPLVWWVGGRVRIFIPRALLNEMDVRNWHWILAHELAHVRRRDHLVRWVEWLACVGFWWNPVVWWAQRNLRAMEEICCDDLVLSRLHPAPKSYAASLFSAVEFLARPAVRIPALASEINSGRCLERRFRMIVSANPNRSSSRWSHRCVLVCMLAVLPLGLASAQDYDAVAQRLKEAVTKGEITQPQAGAMMAALKKEAGRKRSRADLAAIWEKLQAQVRAGELTKEQAREKMTALRAQAAPKDGKDKKTVKKDASKKDQSPADQNAIWGGIAGPGSRGGADQGASP